MPGERVAYDVRLCVQTRIPMPLANASSTNRAAAREIHRPLSDFCELCSAAGLRVEVGAVSVAFGSGLVVDPDGVAVTDGLAVTVCLVDGVAVIVAVGVALTELLFGVEFVTGADVRGAVVRTGVVDVPGAGWLGVTVNRVFACWRPPDCVVWDA